MVEVRVRDQNQIDLGKIIDVNAGMLESLEEENPIGEVRIDQEVQIGELAEEGGVADPGERELAFNKVRKRRRPVPTGPLGEPCLPNHFIKEGAWIEVIAWGQLLKGAGDFALSFQRAWAVALFSVHPQQLTQGPFSPLLNKI